MNFYLTTRAKEDLRNIAIYTKENWGIKQRNSYLGQIDDIFHFIAEFPEKGKKCDEIRSEYHKQNVGKHVVFYRKIKNQIQIVRILHQVMDVDNNI